MSWMTAATRRSTTAPAASLKNGQATLEAAQLRAHRSVELRKIDAVSEQGPMNETTIAELRPGPRPVSPRPRPPLASARVNLGFTRITSPISGRIGKFYGHPGGLGETANQTQGAGHRCSSSIRKSMWTSASPAARNGLALQAGPSVAGRLKAGGAGHPGEILLEEWASDYGAEGTLQFEDVHHR